MNEGLCDQVASSQRRYCFSSRIFFFSYACMTEICWGVYIGSFILCSQRLAVLPLDFMECDVWLKRQE